MLCLPYAAFLMMTLEIPPSILFCKCLKLVYILKQLKIQDFIVTGNRHNYVYYLHHKVYCFGTSIWCCHCFNACKVKYFGKYFFWSYRQQKKLEQIIGSVSVEFPGLLGGVSTNMSLLLKQTDVTINVYQVSIFFLSKLL